MRGKHTFRLPNELAARLDDYATAKRVSRPANWDCSLTLGRKQVEPLRFDTAQRRTIHNLPFPRNPLKPKFGRKLP